MKSSLSASSRKAALPPNTGKAVAVGILTIIGTLILLSFIAAVAVRYVPPERMTRFTTVVLIVWGGAYVAAGYAAGRVTRTKPLVTGITLGVVIATIGLVIQTLVLRQGNVTAEVTQAGATLATTPAGRIMGALVGSIFQIIVVTAGSWLAIATQRPTP